MLSRFNFLRAARSAFNSKDGATSKKLHDMNQRRADQFDDLADQMEHHFPPPSSPEKHKGASGKYLKSMVYGGLDGIITTFSVVSGIAGAGLDPGIVIILGLGNLFADGISMGVGDFLSSQAEQQYAKAEQAREKWECENYLEGEQQEMIELWRDKGLSKEEATTVIDILSKHQDLFVNLMMVEELGIMVEDESAWKHGLVTFIAFVIFGMVSILPYLVLSAWTTQQDDAGFDVAFVTALISVIITLFTLGAFKSKFTLQRWWIAGGLTLLYGGLAAGVAFLIGYILTVSGLVDESC